MGGGVVELDSPVVVGEEEEVRARDGSTRSRLAVEVPSEGVRSQIEEGERLVSAEKKSGCVENLQGGKFVVEI